MKKSEIQDDLSRIEASLKYGNFYGESRKKIIGSYLALALFFFAFMIFAVIMLSVEQVKNPNTIELFVGGLISFIIMCTVVPITWLIIVLKNENLRKKILLWKEDAIEVSAYAKKLGVKYWCGCIQLTKLQIEFNIEGVNYIRSSEQPGKIGRAHV